MTSKAIAVMAATLTIASASASHAREPAPAAETGEPSSIPATLGPYVHDGRFEPGDFGWARGYFPGASPEQAAAVAAIDAWQDACLERNRRHAVEELGARGQDGARLEHASIGDGLCNQYYVPKHDRYDSFADFRAALETTQPIVRSFLAAVEMTDVRAAPRTTELADQLHFHTLAEQMIRSAFGWAGPGTPPSGAPRLTEKQKPILQWFLGQAMHERDVANTAWLKALVEAKGWPTLSQVGKRGAQDAWLLAQHADHDPVFQYEVLQRMKPLIAEGEASPTDYAYLYDRVMLKLAGKQRYATQMQCVDGTYAPRPLEDAGKVDAFRAEAGLEPLEEYRRGFGTC